MTAPARPNDAETHDVDFAPAATLIADPTRAALAAAITTRLFELGWIERGSVGSKGQRRRSVRVTPAGAEGLARTFGLDLVGSCRSCENSW